MTTGLNYAQYVTQISTMAVVQPTDSAFQNILTQMITYAENRMYRDLDFLFTSGSSTAYSLTAGSRVLNVNADTFPYGTLVVPEQINVITPVGTSNPDLGNRVPLLPTTKEFLDACYGSGLPANRSVPQYWVPFDDYTFLVGPYPDASYSVEIVGTYRPQSLGYLPPVTSAEYATVTFSSAHGLATGDTITLYNFFPVEWNATFTVTVTSTTTVTVSTTAAPATTIGTAALPSSTTFISLNLPDVFIMASMIYVSAYQRNFGRANDDPQMAVTYESQYQALLKGAAVEEARKKFEAAGWSSQSPSTFATPTRG
jgi:3D (Asp-Asp-Asp) domain-containing protein